MDIAWNRLSNAIHLNKRSTKLFYFSFENRLVMTSLTVKWFFKVFWKTKQYFEKPKTVSVISHQLLQLYKVWAKSKIHLFPLNVWYLHGRPLNSLFLYSSLTIQQFGCWFYGNMIRVTTVLENPGMSWNRGKNVRRPWKALN